MCASLGSCSGFKSALGNLAACPHLASVEPEVSMSGPATYLPIGQWRSANFEGRRETSSRALPRLISLSSDMLGVLARNPPRHSVVATRQAHVAVVSAAQSCLPQLRNSPQCHRSYTQFIVSKDGFRPRPQGASKDAKWIFSVFQLLSLRCSP